MRPEYRETSKDGHRQVKGLAQTRKFIGGSQVEEFATCIGKPKEELFSLSISAAILFHPQPD